MKEIVLAPRRALLSIVVFFCVATSVTPEAGAQDVEAPQTSAVIDSAAATLSGPAGIGAAVADAPYSEGRRRFLNWAHQDAGSMIRALPAQTPTYLAAGAALVASGSLIDEHILGEIQEQRSPVLKSYLDVVNPLGGPGMLRVTAGIFGVSLLTDNERFQDVAFTSLQSLVYSGVISYALKYTAGRFRPEEGFGPHRFDAFSRNTSFPSGHTTAAFAVVTPWVMYYPHPVTYGLFALSTGTAIARIAKDRHWPTDVIVGGTIGYLTGRYLSKLHMGRTEDGSQPRLEFSPTVGPSGASFSLRVNLD